MRKKFLVLIFLFLIVGASFSLGFYIGKTRVPSPITGVIGKDLLKPEAVDFSLFWEVWRILEKKYVDQARLDFQEMIYGAISGMVKSLKDPYTVFLKPQETKKFIEEVTGVFGGIGAEIGIRKGKLMIIAPLEGTPAKRAGLKAGDEIVKVNGTLGADLTLEEAVDLIRGEPGTEVVLTILRKEWDTPKEIKIIRDIIKIPSLSWEIKDTEIVHLRLYHFTEQAGYDFAKAAVEILNSPAKKIILDLRNNPGGYLEIAQEIAGWFLKRGSIVAIEDFGGKREQKIYRAQGNQKFLDYPMVVLINQGSASGSEILAGALRDNRQVKLIGEKTFGKGSVQELEKLKKGSSLKITVARWLTPNGDLIEGQGLKPDIEVELTEKDIEEGKDPQLEKAIEIIKKME